MAITRFTLQTKIDYEWKIDIWYVLFWKVSMEMIFCEDN